MPTKHSFSLKSAPQLLPNRSRRSGFSLVELAVVIVIILVLIGLCLPAVRSAREASRRMQCTNNLRSLSLAALNYESAWKNLPALWGGPAQLIDRPEQPKYIAHEDAERELPPVGRWSALIAMLPFIEASPSYDSITNSYSDAKGTIESPIAPWNTVNGRYAPWSFNSHPNSWLNCPSDSAPHGPSGPHYNGVHHTNYAFSVGDIFLSSDLQKNFEFTRGTFQGRQGIKLKNIKDGTSNTLLLAEILTSKTTSGKPKPHAEFARSQVFDFHANGNPIESPKDCIELVQKHSNDKKTIPHPWRGLRWNDGAGSITAFSTNVPPNGPSCSLSGTEFGQGYFAAGSNHPGGVNATMADGSVRFISTNIDTGSADAKSSAPPKDKEQIDSPSPYGVWGAMGTIASTDDNPDNTSSAQ